MEESQSSIDFDFFDIPVGSNNHVAKKNSSPSVETVKEEAERVLIKPHKNAESKIHEVLHAVPEVSKAEDCCDLKEKQTDNKSTTRREKKKSHKTKHRKRRSTDTKERYSSGDSVELNRNRIVTKSSNIPSFHIESSTSSSHRECDSDSDLDSITETESSGSGDEEVNVSGSESESDDVTDVSPLSSSLSSIPSPVSDDDSDNAASIGDDVEVTKSKISRRSTSGLEKKVHKLNEPRGEKSLRVMAGGSSNVSEGPRQKKDAARAASDKHCRFGVREEIGSEFAAIEDLGLMLDTVLELRSKSESRCSSSSIGLGSNSSRSSSRVGMSPRVSYSLSRKNHSFTNDDVKKIDAENQRLLKIISDKKSHQSVRKAPVVHNSVRIKSSSFINRQREHKRIAMENAALLKRLQNINPPKTARHKPMRSQPDRSALAERKPNPEPT